MLQRVWLHAFWLPCADQIELPFARVSKRNDTKKLFFNCLLNNAKVWRFGHTIVK